ncbi:MAG: type II secretion system F family protein [Bacillota bacterium]
MIGEIKSMLKIPEVVVPAGLVTVAIMSVSIHRNIDRFRRSATRLKEILEYEATQPNSVFDRYRVSRDTAYKLGRLGAPLNYNTFLAAGAAISLMLSLVSFKALSNPYLGVISPVLWLIFAHQMVDRLYRTRVRARIDAQAQLALQLLAEVYSVSDNLPQAIERIIPSTPQPLRGELEKLVLKFRTNQDLSQCLVDFAGNIDNRDMETFVHGIILSDQFGSDAHEVITKNAEVIRERLALREELINEIRGKKAVTGIFMVLLPVVFLWLLIGNDEAREIFTGTVKGQCLVTFLVLVEYLCWYLDSRREVTEEL